MVEEVLDGALWGLNWCGAGVAEAEGELIVEVLVRRLVDQLGQGERHVTYIETDLKVGEDGIQVDSGGAVVTDECETTVEEIEVCL